MLYEKENCLFILSHMTNNLGDLINYLILEFQYLEFLNRLTQ